MAALVGKFVKPPQTELVKRLPQERLDKQLTEVELSLISEHILDWQSKAYGLGLSSSDVENIREDFKISNKMQKLKMLLRWSEICGEKATLRELIQISRRYEWGGKFIVQACKELGYSYKDESCLLVLKLFISLHWMALLFIIVTLLVAILSPHIYTKFASLSAQSSSLPLPLETFVGRQEELRNLTLLLKYTHDAPRIMSITGGPGFGKSTLAIHIGNELKDRGVNVIYVSMNEVPSVHVLTRKILSSDDSEIENSNKNVTLHQLHKWSKELQHKTLLILDNCDEQFHVNKDQLQKFITELVRHSRHQTLKVLTTSRQQVMYLQAHEPFILNELPKHHACVLLRNIASFTNSSCNDIISLTGNVPLALHVIGALMKMPNPPSHRKIVEKLKENLIETLSPENLQTEERVNASIHLSYQYLDATLKKIGRLLAHFPGSFDEDAACRILQTVNTSIMCIHNLQFLVQRSLIEHNTDSNRYNYHRLIREFFIAKSSPADFKKFYRVFSEYFIERMTEKSFTRMINFFDADQHNIQYLFDSLTTLKDEKQKRIVEIFMNIAETLNHIMDSHNLDYKFTPMELQEYLKTIIFYFERNRHHIIKIFSKGQFVQVYSRVIMHLVSVKQYLIKDIVALIDIMEKYRQFFYKHKSFMSSDLYRKFFYILAKYYEEVGDHKRAIQCFKKRIDQECKQSECNHVEIGDAYYQMNDYNKSIHFYERELSSTNNAMETFKILLKLYDIHTIQQNSFQVDETVFRLIHNIITITNISELVSHGPTILCVLDKIYTNKFASVHLEFLLTRSIQDATISHMSELNDTLYAAFFGHKYNIVKIVGGKMLEVNKLPVNKYYGNTSFFLGIASYWTGDYNASHIHFINYLTFQKSLPSFYGKSAATYYLAKMGSVAYLLDFWWRPIVWLFIIPIDHQVPQFSTSQTVLYSTGTNNDLMLSTELVSTTSVVTVFQVMANTPQVKYFTKLIYSMYHKCIPILHIYFYFCYIYAEVRLRTIVFWPILEMLFNGQFISLFTWVILFAFAFDFSTTAHQTGYINITTTFLIDYGFRVIILISDLFNLNLFTI